MNRSLLKQLLCRFEPDEWSPAKRSQKDIDARWVKKNRTNHFGYKNHVQIDAGGKFIRNYAVTDASVHDSQVFESLLDERNSSREVFADSAYRSKEKESSLKAMGFRPRLQHKGLRNKSLSERKIQGDRTRAKIRSRAEHVIGIQTRRDGNLIIRAIEIVWAKVKIGLRNLAYNLDRYASFMEGKHIKELLKAKTSENI